MKKDSGPESERVNRGARRRVPASGRHGRRLPIGAEVTDDGAHFRVWAPRAQTLELLIEESGKSPAQFKFSAEENGYFSLSVPDLRDGVRYWIRLNEQASKTFADPASRFQPYGPFGSSQLVDHRFKWRDAAWKGPQLKGQVLYEMHIGTFTKEGSWQAAAKQLEELARLGVTTLEVMPVAEFPGRFGWGYDGVNLFAPTWLYGSPNDFRHFVDAAHHHGLSVILDVVYNHLGPDGNFLKEFSEDYFSKIHTTAWGEAINFDGENSAPVREFILTNVAYWIQEFHLDGFRVDATQDIRDDGQPNILAEISRVARAAAGDRRVLVIGENEPQEMGLVRPAEAGGYGMDALWNDDFHHSAMVALTGRTEAYYTDFEGTSQEFVSAAKHGTLYQGQWYSWQKQGRGTPALDLTPQTFVTFIQNHDQLANSARGKRIHQITSLGRYRAMTALLLLGPQTPMLFQGQEFAATTPFRYFSDHKPEVARLVFNGRNEYLSQFRSLRDEGSRVLLADPGNPTVFESCKLNFSERHGNEEIYAMHRELLRLRREDVVFQLQGERGIDGAVLSRHAFVLRFFGDCGEDRLLLVNFSTDLQLRVCPEPLLAAPAGKEWDVMFSTEDPSFGGSGFFRPDAQGCWIVPGEAAMVLSPVSSGTVEPEPAAEPKTHVLHYLPELPAKEKKAKGKGK